MPPLRIQDEYQQIFAIFEPLPPGVIGVHARDLTHSQLTRPDAEAIAQCAEEFLSAAGLSCKRSTPLQIGAGATVGSEMLETVFSWMKPIGLTVQIVRFALGWFGRMAAYKRRLLMPRIGVVLSADHIVPLCSTSTTSWDAASAIVLLLPELQEHLETQYPTINFQYDIWARGLTVNRVHIRGGNGLRITDAQVLNMLKMLGGSAPAPSLSFHHLQGWFGYSKVVDTRQVPWSPQQRKRHGQNGPQ